MGVCGITIFAHSNTIKLTHTHMQVDTIDPVSGVTVREAGRTVHGPQAHKTLTGYARESTLAPIQSPRMNHNYSDSSSNRSTYVDVQ